VSNWDTRFTGLGLSGAGKTCYIVGMYSEMASGIRGWTVKTANADADKIQRQLKKMEKQTGDERFPAGTQDYAFDDYEFELRFRNQKVMHFNWVDYAGGILEQNDLNYDTAQLLEDSILQSTTLYIFIDGTLLCDGTTRQKIKRVKSSCGNYIHNKIIRFMNEHENKMPPVVFVITKSDLFSGHTSMKEIKEVLTESFSTIFYSDETLAYIVPVSLGDEIAEDNYSGMLEPVNIQTPFFIGIAHDFFNKCAMLMEEIQKDNDSIQLIISICEQKIARDKNAVSVSQQSIQETQRKMDERNQNIQSREEENQEYERKIQEAQKRARKKEEQLRREKKYIEDKTSGFLGFFRQMFGSSDLTKARENINKYKKQKAYAVRDANINQNKISSNQETIKEYQSQNKEDQKQMQDKRHAISTVESDIRQQTSEIERLEEKIQHNMEKRQEYIEMLADIENELKTQQQKQQFIAIRKQQEFPVSFDLKMES